MQVITVLPKVELHCHLEGGVTPETVCDLLKEQRGVDAALSEVKEKIQVTDCCRNLEEYLTKFDLIVQCLQTPEAIRRAAREVVENAAKEGVIYIEVRFAPQLLRQNGLSCQQVVENVLAGLEDGQTKTGTIGHPILICMRNHSLEQNLEVVRTANEFRSKGVVALDLAGDEALYPPLKFMDVFLLAQKYNISFTLHAGECGNRENIKDAILMGASRLGHGIQAKYDKDLIDFIAKKGIGVEMCPTSNLHTHSIAGWEEYPVREFYEKGVKIAICTDDPTVSNTDLNKEMSILIEKFQFKLIDLKNITLSSIDISFATQQEKNKLKRIVESKFASVLKEES